MRNTASEEALLERLAMELGSEAVDISAEELDAMATDALGLRGGIVPAAMPLAIVRPADAAAVSRAVALASDAGVAIVPYGAGTGLMGGARSVTKDIVLDTSALNAIDIRAEDRMAWAGAGAILSDVDKALRSHGLCLGHDPWTFPVATVGGPISTNGLGYKGGRYGGMGDQVVALEIVLADGTLFRTPAIPRRSTGPDLNRIFIGAEGTLGVITAAALRAFALPEAETLLGFRFDRFEQGFEAICELAYLGMRPSLLDYGEEHRSPWPELSARREEPPVLYLGFEGFREEVAASAVRAAAVCSLRGGRPVPEVEVRRFWEDRHVVAERFRRPRRERGQRPAGVDYIHVAVPASKVLDFRALCHREAPAANVGLVECGLWTAPELFSAVFVSPPEPGALERVTAVIDSLLQAAQDLGGSMEYVHGAGLRYAALMQREHGAGMTVLRRVKSALDPKGVLNPGKLGLSAGGPG